MGSDPARAVHARPRPFYESIADAGSIARSGEDIAAGNPGGWPGYEDRLRRARQAAGARHAVTTGTATVGGEPCVLIGFEFLFMGGSMGVAEGERIARAFSLAAAERLPVVSVAATGGTRIQEGTSALTQMQAVAKSVAQARQAGIPHIAVAGDPTTGGVWSSLAASADLLISVPGARVSFSGSRTRPAGVDTASADYLSDGQWAHGFIDAISPPHGLRSEVAAAVRLLSPRSRGEGLDRAPLPPWPAGDDSSGPQPDPWAQVVAARSAPRPLAEAWLAGYFGETVEIRGDRCGGVDTGLRCGFGRHRDATVGYVAQTGERTTPAGYRTATRLIELAARLRVPILTLIDTPGAAAAPQDEASGLGPALAELFVAIASSPVPITSVVIGEGVSGGALALASQDDLWIARDGYLAVTSPEMAASILKLGPEDVPRVAAMLRLTPEELSRRGIVRGVVGPSSAR